MRSKRFMTLRFPPSVEAARRLRCCDIKCFLLKFDPASAKSGRRLYQPPSGLPIANLEQSFLRPHLGCPSKPDAEAKQGMLSSAD